MKAYRYLSQVLRLNRKINAKLEEKAQILDMVTKITPTISDMPKGGGNHDKIGDAVARLVAVEHEINRTIDKFVDTRDEILRTLEGLPDKEYTVLHGYYIQGQTVEAIADGWQPEPMSVRNAYRIKARGLRRVQAILDAREAAAMENESLGI